MKRRETGMAKRDRSDGEEGQVGEEKRGEREWGVDTGLESEPGLARPMICKQKRRRGRLQGASIASVAWLIVAGLPVVDWLEPASSLRPCFPSSCEKFD
jgi:hypothetical protein